MNPKSIVLILAVNELNETNAVYSAVQNFIDIYETEVDRIAIIGPTTIDIDRDVVDPIPVQRSSSPSHILFSIMDFIYYQIKISEKLWKEQSCADFVFFHIGGSLLFFPMITSQFSGFQSFVFITGSTEKSFYAQYGRHPLAKIFMQIVRLVESLTCSFSDDVILLSESMDLPTIRWPFSTRIRVANFNYIDCGEFEKRSKIEDRTVDVVFIGRFEPVKGVRNIIQALPDLIDRYPELQANFIGAGGQQEALEEFVEEHDLSDHVTFTGWIDREEIPDYLNESRLLLMPSESEGVPKTLLEAMACGTIPIAAPVGGIPDLVTDGENGFLLSDTEPTTIAEVILQVLNQDGLDHISDNARTYIEKNHSYTRMQEYYKSMLGQ